MSPRNWKSLLDARAALCACLLIVSALALAACGSSGDDTTGEGGGGEESASESVQIDVGTDTPIEAETDKPSIAYLWTSGDTNVEANKEGAEEEAERLGLELTVFDAKFDPLRQVEQVQNVLQQDRFDAMIVIPLDTNSLCPILSKEAPSENVAVVTQDITLCNKLADEGPEAWIPGTLAHAGLPPAKDVNRQFYREVAEQRGPGKHVAALLVGPEGNSATNSSLEALEEVEGEISDKLEVPYKIYTDFSTPDGLAKTQTLLQAHPEIDTIMSIYTDLSIGAARAIDQAGRKGEVLVYDQGGSQLAADAVKRGDLALTTAFHSKKWGSEAVKAIADAFAGEEVQRYYGGYPPNSDEEENGKRLIITKENVDEYEPEY